LQCAIDHLVDPYLSPTSETALVLLCGATAPYNAWAKLQDLFGDRGEAASFLVIFVTSRQMSDVKGMSQPLRAGDMSRGPQAFVSVTSEGRSGKGGLRGKRGSGEAKRRPTFMRLRPLAAL
jgi:hypothetical protein